MAANFRRLLQERRLLKVAMLGQLCHPKIVEIIAYHGGFDGVWFDQEHVGLGIPVIEDCSRAARAADISCFVRLNATDYATLMRPLEAGATGFMASMVRSAKQAEEIVNWSRFAPEGMRGVNGTGVDGRYGTMGGDYFRHANEETAIGIQIEHADAIREIDAIAAIPGVDFLFIGPADLSQTLGIAGQWEHPTMWESVGKVAAACKRNNLPWGILPRNPEYARRCVEMGCGILSIGIDVWFLDRGIGAFQADYREFFPTNASAPKG